MNSHSPFVLLPLLCCTLAIGCGKSADEAEAPLPATPAQAATAVESTFASAPPAIQTSARAAAQAMRDGDYEKAVVALQTVKTAPSMTMDQGMAVHGSMITLEARLIAAIEAGDPKAKRAYDLLKQLKRN